MADVTPKAGDWVLYRGRYERVSVEMQQADKVTPKLVKFTGTGWPRQCAMVAVVASFADKETAARVRDAIAGVAGEFSRRRRAAEDERSKRITQALTAANAQVDRILAKAKGEDGEASNG